VLLYVWWHHSMRHGLKGVGSLLVGVLVVGGAMDVIMGGALSQALPAVIPGGGGGVVTVGTLAAGKPFGGACKPVETQGYGPVDNTAEPIIGGQHFHTGIDLACPAGTPIYSVTPGTATTQSTAQSGGYGNNVVVHFKQNGSDYYVRYAHMSAVGVQSGATVQVGDRLGWEGSTGNSTGPHLHFEVDRGAALGTASLNPASYLS